MEEQGHPSMQSRVLFGHKMNNSITLPLYMLKTADLKIPTRLVPNLW